MKVTKEALLSTLTTFAAAIKSNDTTLVQYATMRLNVILSSLPPEWDDATPQETKTEAEK
jgi:hypothetical protein